MLRRLPVLRTTRRLYHVDECSLLQIMSLGPSGKLEDRLDYLRVQRVPMNGQNFDKLIEFTRSMKNLYYGYSLTCVACGALMLQGVPACTPIFLGVSVVLWLKGLIVGSHVRTLREHRQNYTGPVLGYGNVPNQPYV
jgi:hypothetical protein